nr:radical SAM protein [uncultured bacterium]
MALPRVAFIELTVFSRVYPLASGYMRAAAGQDARVNRAFEFEIHSSCINNPRLLQELNAIDADVYAISCYVWNMGFVKRWLPTVIARKPDAHVILGGPQVMNQGAQYLDPSHERIVICNGEGEHTFTNYLAELCSFAPNLAAVKGLTFYRRGERVTTPPQDRIQDLDAIPSPYLEGYLDPEKYGWAPIETNRGCPFQCTYCYWGAATNAKVFKSDLGRVKAEITWLSQNRALYLFITDANFGMLKRDLDIAAHLAECKRRFGYPMTVFFSSAKNSPERVTEITQELSRADLISTQPVSLQTLDPRTLVSVKRSNIKESSYTTLQAQLAASNLSSFLEMIWPLPGETFETFTNGLGRLCASDADAFVIHHLLLLNNVDMSSQREEYQIQTTRDADPNSEAQVVVATKDVTPDEYKEGVRFGFHLTSLYSLRALRFVGRYLNSTGRMDFKTLITAFSEYCKTKPSDPYMEYINDVIALSGQTKFSANGGIFHVTLHEFRREFDLLLHGFMQSRRLLDDEFTAFHFEMDLLNRPHVYSNTAITNGDGLLKLIQVVAKDRDGMVVRVPAKYGDAATGMLGLPQSATRYSIKYRTGQMPFMPSRSHEDNLSYCESKLHKIRSILPAWAAA